VIVTYRTATGPLVLMLDAESTIDLFEWEVGPRAFHADQMDGGA
jgi:hypothetical protein